MWASRCKKKYEELVAESCQEKACDHFASTSLRVLLVTSCVTSAESQKSNGLINIGDVSGKLYTPAAVIVSQRPVVS